MFNWFRKYNSTPEIPLVPKVTPIPPIDLPQPGLKDHYRVGYDPESGSTTLTLHSDYTSMTLTLSPEEVLRLIRLLGASLDDEFLTGEHIDHDDDED